MKENADVQNKVGVQSKEPKEEAKGMPHNLLVGRTEQELKDPLSLSNGEQGIIAQVVELFNIKSSSNLLPKLGGMLQEDVDRLSYIQSLGLNVNEYNIFSLLSIDLNDNDIKALAQLQKCGVDLTKYSMERLDEYKKVGEFLSSLGNDEPGIWIKSHIKALLQRKTSWHKYGLYEIKGIYYYYKVLYDGRKIFKKGVDDLAHAYETIYSDTSVLEFISKMGLSREFGGVVFYGFVREIPIEVRKFIQENLKSFSEKDVNRFSHFFEKRHNLVYRHNGPFGREYYNFDSDKDGERVDSALKIIKEYYLKNENEITSDTLLRWLSFVLNMNIDGRSLYKYFESGDITTDDMKKVCDILCKFK